MIWSEEEDFFSISEDEMIWSLYDDYHPEAQCTAPEEEEDFFSISEDDEAREVIAEWINEGKQEEEDIPW